MSVSIADVAKRAKVSISTVSRVINRRNIVNPKTRERVDVAIRELGYRPNAFARGLMLKKSDIVGLVLPDLHGEFYSEIIRGASAQARRDGYNLVIASTQDGDDSHTILHAVSQRAILDGLAVMVSELNGRVRDTLTKLRLPFVVLDDDIPGAPHDSVLIDQGSGARALVRHLIETRGARRIIFVGGLETNVDTIARFKAYREELERAGITAREQDVFYLDYRYETAYELARERACEWAGPGSCVFAANDEMAAGIIAAAVACRIKLPADLGVVGFEDTRIARMTSPPLTTVRVPMARMGEEALRLLCRRIAEPDSPAVRVSLEPELIVRDSCAIRSRE